MSRHQKDPLRPLTADERTELTRLSRSPSAPAAQVDRARALLAIADGASYTAAAHQVGRGTTRPSRPGSAASTARGWPPCARTMAAGRASAMALTQQQRILAEWARPPAARAGRHRHLVLEPAAEGLAPGAGRAAAGQHVHDLAHPARGRPELAEEPHLVRDRRGAAPPQGRRGARQRSRCDGQKKLIEQAYTLGCAAGALGLVRG